jgi:hypothetical protein
MGRVPLPPLAAVVSFVDCITGATWTGSGRS